MTFPQSVHGSVEKVKQTVKVPDGYDAVKIAGSMAQLLKERGKNVWISQDLDSYKTGSTWKRAVDKPENLFGRETREGTYNADLT